MASYYVWSGATGSANGSSWANAFTTLTTAFATEVAGDTLYVAHDHAESSATALTLTLSGSTVTMTKVVCANRAGSVPPVSADLRATAQVATTGNVGINFAGGACHYYGIIFIAGNSTGLVNIAVPSAASGSMRFDACSLQIGSTGAGKLLVGNNNTGSGGYVEFNNTTVSFSAITQGFGICAVLKWRNTASALLGTIPTALFTPAAAAGGEVECIGVDLSAAGSGKTLCSVLVSNSDALKFKFVDCKLDAAVTKASIPGAPGAVEVDFIRSGASGNYTVARFRHAGTLTEETTIVRTGGATDGTTPIAWKVVTASTNTTSYSMPFECPPIAIWNDTTGSARTATVEGIWGGGAVPLDSEIWLECEFLGNASTPQGSFANDGTPDLLTTPANQTSSSATWGGSTTKFKLDVTFTPQQKGWIYARVKCAKINTTFYIDPLVTLT